MGYNVTMIPIAAGGWWLMGGGTFYLGGWVLKCRVSLPTDQPTDRPTPRPSMADRRRPLPLAPRPAAALGRRRLHGREQRERGAVEPHAAPLPAAEDAAAAAAAREGRPLTACCWVGGSADDLLISSAVPAVLFSLYLHWRSSSILRAAPSASALWGSPPSLYIRLARPDLGFGSSWT
jgi:hypothetical protein